AGGAMYLGLPAMFERRSYQEEKPIPLSVALKATFVNRSFVAVVVAQTLRFFATNTLTIGMMFYMKYSVKADPGLTTIILGVVFISAGAFLWPWRRFVARHLSTRTTTMLAYAATGLAVIPLGFAHSTAMAIVGGVFIGLGLAGLNLVGDVIMADVVDEDDVKTGQRRAGMFFGLSSLWTILSSSLVALIFGWVTRTYGYDTALAVQPASVDLGFRVFMTIPPAIGCMMAIVALWFYPLHGERLARVKAALAARNAEK
ncbi:MAG: MFS transporter, partial [Chloroflexi bacterium]|nr:MFS transporter [Chloroflexota bacterium]